ncbi:DUF2158 domain-containing protein [Achromobacter xylosoxidans]
MSQFQLGDVVMLKSGGVLMTVKEVGDYSNFMGPVDGVMCIWQDEKGKTDTKVFEAFLLKKVEID